MSDLTLAAHRATAAGLAVAGLAATGVAAAVVEEARLARAALTVSKEEKPSLE